MAHCKYRLLTNEELHELEKEFVDYLVINGITADDWERLKKEENEKAEEIIALFSDVVFEGVLRKTEYLERRSQQSIHTFHCQNDKMELYAIETDDPQADFTDPEYLKTAISNPAGIHIFSAEKPYNGNREAELFGMTMNGCALSDGALFKTLQNLKQ